MVAPHRLFVLLLLVVSGCTAYTEHRIADKASEELREQQELIAYNAECHEACAGWTPNEVRMECIVACQNQCEGSLSCAENFTGLSGGSSEPSVRKCKEQVQEGMIVRCVEWE